LNVDTGELIRKMKGKEREHLNVTGVLIIDRKRGHWNEGVRFRKLIKRKSKRKGLGKNGTRSHTKERFSRTTQRRWAGDFEFCNTFVKVKRHHRTGRAVN